MCTPKMIRSTARAVSFTARAVLFEAYVCGAFGYHKKYFNLYKSRIATLSHGT